MNLRKLTKRTALRDSKATKQSKRTSKVSDAEDVERDIENRSYKAKKFRNAEEANKFLADNPEYGVIDLENDEVYVSLNEDKGKEKIKDSIILEDKVEELFDVLAPLTVGGYADIEHNGHTLAVLVSENNGIEEFTLLLDPEIDDQNTLFPNTGKELYKWGEGIEPDSEVMATPDANDEYSWSKEYQEFPSPFSEGHRNKLVKILNSI